MTDQQLDDLLGKIGKGCFVQLYEAFADLSLPNSAIIPSVVKYVKDNGKENPSYKAANTRISKARSIIKSGNGRVALLNCSRSRICPELQRKAARLAGA